jgi:aryl-alcohol dehydrogenase-like predicted oxidoreductase
MQKRPFGRTGLSVSSLGFGGGPIGNLKTDQEKVANILNFLLDNGVNVIDTAASYQGSEVLIGDTIGHRRKDYVLISKCGRKVEGDDPLTGEDWSADLIARSVDRSLRRLKTDHLDVLLLHSCDLATLQKGEALGALVKAKQQGKIRHAGYSGDNDTVAYSCSLPDVAVIETSLNIADQMNIDKALPAAAKHNVGVIVKRPIANSAWRNDLPEAYKGYAAPYTERIEKMQLQPTDAGLPQDAWAEMALRFTLSFPQAHTAIIGTTNPHNAKANIEAANKGPLPPDAIKKIRAAFQHADPTHSWEGLT